MSSATPTIGSVDQPRRSAIAIASRTWRSASVDALGQVRHRAERRQAADLEVRAGRAGAPSASASSRCASASASRSVQLSAIPRFISANASSSCADRRALALQQRGRLVDDGLDLAEAPGAQQHDRRERGPRAVAARRPARRAAPPARRRSAPSASPQRDSSQQVRGRDRRQLRVGPDAPRRQPGEQRAERLLLAVEQQVHPVAAEQLAGQVPVAGELRVPDRLDRVAVLGVPPGREPVQPGDRVGGAALELQPQQVGEQVVAAEPRARDVDGDDERVGVLEVLQDPRAVARARSGGRRAGR